MLLIRVSVVGVLLLASCSPLPSPTAVPTPAVASLATAAPIVATPPPGPTLVLHAYMQDVYEGVLVQFARRVALNRDLLSTASSQGSDAAILCPGSGGSPWQEFDNLALELSLLLAPPQAEEFHAALAEALAAADRSVESQEWFCETYASFGQPAEGMWSRLSAQVRACESRMADLRSHWRAIGGEAAGLVW